MQPSLPEKERPVVGQPPHLAISVLCATIPVFSIGAYHFMRAGFPAGHWETYARLLGISLFLLFVGDTLGWVLRSGGKAASAAWYRAEAIIPFYALALLFAAGYASARTSLDLAMPPVLLGYLFAAAALFRFVRASRPGYLLAGLGLSLFLCLWVAANTLRPTVLESLVAGTVQIDFWFHASVAQMIRTYGVPSTGFDGVPWMYYHYGSHTLIAHLASLLRVSVVQMYALGYGVIVVPLFFKMYLTFAFTVRQLVARPAGASSAGKIDYLTMLVFLCFFLQVVKNLYSGLFLGYNFLGSESYTTGLAFLFALGSTGLSFWHAGGMASRKHRLAFFFGFLPVALVVLGFLKISLLYLVMALFAYLFLRLQWFKHAALWLCGALLTVIALGVYLLTVETILFGGRQVGYEGQTKLFYFFRETHPFEPLNFFLFFFLWSYLFIAVFVVVERTRNGRRWRDAFRQRRTLGVELVVLVCVAGLLPGFFLVLTGGNAMYFSGFQALFSSALVIAFLPLVGQRIREAGFVRRLRPGYRIAIATVLSVAVFLVLYMNLRMKVNQELTDDFALRKTLLADPTPESFNLSEALGLLFGEARSANQQKFAYFRSPAVGEALRRDTVYAYVQRLAALDRRAVAEKRTHSVYADYQRGNLPFRAPCYIVPFLVPALSGMAALYGVPYDCPMGAYGYEYYNSRYKGHPGWDHVYLPEELCRMAAQHQFSNVLILNFKDLRFRPLPCR